LSAGKGEREKSVYLPEGHRAREEIRHREKKFTIHLFEKGEKGLRANIIKKDVVAEPKKKDYPNKGGKKK